MQDRYAADVGDFGKLGLLRHLTSGPSPLRLGVMWYRVPDESGNNDGGHISDLTSDAKQHVHRPRAQAHLPSGPGRACPRPTAPGPSYPVADIQAQIDTLGTKVLDEPTRALDTGGGANRTPGIEQPAAKDEVTQR